MDVCPTTVSPKRSLRAPIVSCLPDDTAHVARAAFPRDNPSLRVYDAPGPLSRNPQFAALFPKEGQPAIARAQRALVTSFQLAEGLSDRPAADAVGTRIVPGFDASVLREFRDRLIAQGAEALLCEVLLALL